MSKNSPHIHSSEKIIENFAVHGWLSALTATSFAGASFGFFDASTSLLVAFLVGSLSFITLKMAYDARDKKDALKLLSDIIAIAGLVGFALMFNSFGILMGLIVLLFSLHLALNLTFREHRIIYFPLLIDFVALMAGAVFTFSTGYLFYMLLFCVFVCFYLAVAYVDRQQYDMIERFAENNENNSLKFHINNRATVDYLGDWRYWDKLLLAMGISLLTGVIYLLMPHFTAGNIGGLPLTGYEKYGNEVNARVLPAGSNLSDKFSEPQDGDSDGAPMPEESIQQDNSIYFYVKSDKTRYLQNKTANYFDGASWHRLQNGLRLLPASGDSFTLYDEEPNASVAITVVKNARQDILTTDDTIGLRFPSAWVATDYYDQLKTDKALEIESSYELLLHEKHINGRAIDTQQAKPSERDIALPSDLDPRIQTLGNQIVLGKSRDFDKAQALEKHLRTQYQYTLDTLANQNNVPLSDFLFGSQRGHCEYFATSMAVMLRQQGIPARMIYGFVAEDFNPMTGFYEVKGTNAHAWVEAYIDGSWAIYEATGAYDAPEQSPENATPKTYETVEKYLEKQRQYAERNKENMTFGEKVQYNALRFWAFIVATFSALISWLKISLPWIVGISVIVIGGFWFRNRWQRKNATRILDSRDFKQLKKLGKQSVNNKKEMKSYIHAHLSHYQAMLARHNHNRAIGERIERFATELKYEDLATENQVATLISWVNGNFYESDAPMPTAEKVHSLFVDLYEQAVIK